jgi:UDP-N-acetylglucosamine diphosphorylase/glucosamine-1-phosphate N-acetyltransferase
LAGTIRIRQQPAEATVIRNVLFEDHTAARLRPLSWSVPAYEVRCGLFSTRERLDLADPGAGGVVLCRPVLLPLHTAPGWHGPTGELTDRSFWVNGRLAPRCSLVNALHELRDQDWVLHDESGLLAAALSPEMGAMLLASWRKWSDADAIDTVWAMPQQLAGLPPPTLPPLSDRLDLGWIWDLVPATGAAIVTDLAQVSGGVRYARHPFGIVAETNAEWQQPGSLRRLAPDLVPASVHVSGQGGVYLGSSGVDLAPGTHLDTGAGPIILDGGVRVMPHAYLAGPLYVGRQSVIKPGARIFGESSFGVGNRLAGEIGESTFGEFANKQHDGFIGHAVLGSWINLGAMTTCSDLKNNYGPVRVDLGGGQQDSDQRFVGLLMADHAKTAIGSLFNTGTVVGFASNIFGSGMPPKYVPGFSWGGQDGSAHYEVNSARQTAAIVMQRRGCRWTADHERLFDHLHGATRA